MPFLLELSRLYYPMQKSSFLKAPRSEGEGFGVRVKSPVNWHMTEHF